MYFDNLKVHHYQWLLQGEFHYYPFGGSLSLSRGFNAGQQPQLFTNQTFERNEFGDGKGLYMYDFEARMYDVQIGRWWGVDPLGEKYVSTSPLAYAINNPIYFVDPDGRQIEPASQNNWNQHKANLTQEYQNNIGQIAQLIVIMMNGNGTEGSDLNYLAQKGSLLKGTLDGMSKMEDHNNSQVYSLDNGKCITCVLRMDDNGTVVIPTNGGSTETFVHEVTHGIQFENNALAFIKGTTSSITSFSNEVDAYKSQAAYAGFGGLNGINPNVPNVSSFSQINNTFISGIQSSGIKVYNNLAQTPINPGLKGSDIVKAFPSMSTWKIKPTETLRSVLSGAFGGSAVTWRH